ncbi:MAG: hypothetical protein PWQ57_1672 [Desulfovibrionales bacterium]|jgi:nitrogen fixation NifU-like protein|nr:hypothetical protein [Desulfovibrionales bacterium]
MPDKLETYLDGLQRQINEDAEKRYGPTGYQRWREPKFVGPLKNPHGTSKVSGSCGDTIMIFLRFEDGAVSQASYLTDGCASSQICASFAAELAHGKTPDELADFSGQTILDVLGDFPEDDRHCAHLAAESLKEAVGDYLRKSGGD